MRAITIKTKKEYIDYFKELYLREPSENELKAFIECVKAKENEKEG